MRGDFLSIRVWLQAVFKKSLLTSRTSSSSGAAIHI